MKCGLLYLVGQLGIGGSERQLYYLLQGLDRTKFNPAVVVWNYNKNDSYLEKIRELGVPLYYWNPNCSRVFKLKAFRRLVLQVRPEVVHSFSFHTNFLAWLATYGSTALPIGSIRSNFISEVDRAGGLLGRISARWPRNQICNSITAKVNAANRSGLFKPACVFVVRNGLDLNIFKPIFPQPHLPVLLAIGRLSSEKGWENLIKIISTVVTKGLKFTIYHVGDGPLRQALEIQVKELGMEETFRFLGTRNDIPSILAASSFFVHAALDEGSPNVVMEAMACGRAVVATDAGDVPFLVDDGKTGFVVKRGDNVVFAERISQLLADPDLCARMGEAGRSKAVNEFRLDRLVVETLKAYRSMGWKN